MPFWRTFARVTVPICMPAILDIAVYMFVNALTTVSAVIFLYGAGTKLASIAIVHMDEAGATAAAAAMATMIMLTAHRAPSCLHPRSTAWSSSACRPGGSDDVTSFQAGRNPVVANPRATPT